MTDDDLREAYHTYWPNAESEGEEAKLHPPIKLFTPYGRINFRYDRGGGNRPPKNPDIPRRYSYSLWDPKACREKRFEDILEKHKLDLKVQENLGPNPSCGDLGFMTWHHLYHALDRPCRARAQKNVIGLWLPCSSHTKARDHGHDHRIPRTEDP